MEVVCRVTVMSKTFFDVSGLICVLAARLDIINVVINQFFPPLLMNVSGISGSTKPVQNLSVHKDADSGRSFFSSELPRVSALSRRNRAPKRKTRRTYKRYGSAYRTTRRRYSRRAPRRTSYYGYY